MSRFPSINVALAQRMSAKLGAELQPFEVRIGVKGQPPRISFGVMAPDSMTAWDQHADLAEGLERCEIVPTRPDLFPVRAQCHQLEEAQLRELRPFYPDAMDVKDVEVLRREGWI